MLLGCWRLAGSRLAGRRHTGRENEPVLLIGKYWLLKTIEEFELKGLGRECENGTASIHTFPPWWPTCNIKEDIKKLIKKLFLAVTTLRTMVKPLPVSHSNEKATCIKA